MDSNRILILSIFFVLLLLFFPPLCYTKGMTDINKTILEKAAGPSRLHPDEQRRFLETYSERAIASCSLADAREKALLQNFPTILTDSSDHFQPVFVKISPSLDESYQLQYLKMTKEQGIVASIVSDDCKNSPFGLIIHTDHPSGIDPTDIRLQYSQLFEEENQAPTSKKTSFWKRLFG